MPSLSEITAFQGAVDDVGVLTIADLVSFWRSLDPGDPVPTAVALREFLPELVDAYSPLAAEVAASFYDDVRIQSAAAGGFVAELAPAANSDQMQKLIGWAVEPLFRTATETGFALGRVLTETTPTPNPDLALSRLSGTSQRLVADGARETIEINTEADPAKPRYARHASANACAFCAMLATRGPAYRSAESAGGKYHDHCHCVSVPVFGDDYESAPYVADWSRAYYAATKKLGGASDTKAILAELRQTLGAA